jgi:hypothetical protein
MVISITEAQSLYKAGKPIGIRSTSVLINETAALSPEPVYLRVMDLLYTRDIRLPRTCVTHRYV